MWKILAIVLMLCPSVASAQYEWKGRSYSGRLCPNPNCEMCNSIEAQKLAAQQVVQQPKSVTNWTQNGTGYRTETTLEARTQQVRHCNGRNCWYETVTTMVPVTRQVPIAQAAAITPPAKASPAVNVLTNTELVPTPQAVVDAMLEELSPSNKAKLFDLGSGDGRIVITAAKTFGCTAVGIELNPETIAQARVNALTEYVNPLVVFFQGDVRSYDLQSAQYVTMYLYPELMAEIVPKIKSGTKVASYQHEIPGMPNTKHTVDVDGQSHTFYTGINP